MPPTLDQTHNPNLRSWVQDANGHPDFPIQNLPFGIFEPPGDKPRGGVAIGDHILDLYKLSVSGLLSPAGSELATKASLHSLNSFLEQGPAARNLLRHTISALLAEGAPERPELLHLAADCVLHLPATIGDYTDFYAGIHHAQNVGQLFRPGNPLLENYKWVPIGYHGRSSSIRVSGHPVRRPNGQLKPPTETAPTFASTQRLDFELELGIWIGPGNGLGDPIPIDDAQNHIAGFCLLNDWSARDIQTWEYQPLGPFLAKNFHTTVSPWIITPEALAPFHQPQPPRDPRPLPYLHSDAGQALNITLEAYLTTPTMRAQNLPPHRLTQTNTVNLFWTPAQLLTHHASNGCNLTPGDLLGTGTISSATPEGFGSLLEITRNGAQSLTLPTGETRTFLHDADEITLRAHTTREGFISIGFGECRATILPARTTPR